MSDALAADSLVLDRGQLIYVYPFTLDRISETSGISEIGATYPLRLADTDVDFRFQDPRRTDAWELRNDRQEFADRGELVLGDGYEVRFRPKWVEKEAVLTGETLDDQFHVFQLRAVLAKHGGHYVRLETQIGVMADPASPDPWAGAHVDQWVRRLNADAGADRVSIYKRGVSDPVAEWPTLHAFAMALASAVDQVDNPATAKNHPDDVPDLVGESVIFHVDAARVIAANGMARPLEASDDISSMTGYSALMATSRYLPASVEEWVRLDAPPLENLFDGLRPFGDVLLVNDDVITLLSLGSPNWVTMEQLEMLEFAVSLHGYLEHLSVHLRDRLRSDEEAKQVKIVEVTADIREGNHALELLRCRYLMRSRYHSELLARILKATGASALESRVESTVQALRDVRSELEEDERRKQAENLGLTVFLLTTITGFIGIYSFVRAFFPDHVGGWGELLITLFAVALTAAVAVVYVTADRRSTDE